MLRRHTPIPSSRSQPVELSGDSTSLEAGAPVESLITAQPPTDGAERAIGTYSGLLVGIAVLLGLGLILVSAANYRDALVASDSMVERHGLDLVKNAGLFSSENFYTFLNDVEANVVAGELTHVSVWSDCQRVVELGQSAFPRLCPTPFKLQRKAERSRMTFEANALRALSHSDLSNVAGFSHPAISAVAIEFNAPGANAYPARALMSLWLASAVGVLLAASSFYVWWLALRARRMAEALQTQRHIATLGTLSAVLAHELRNPLAALKGNLQLLAEQPSGPKVKARSERAVRSVTRLERVVRDLLEFARSGTICMVSTSPMELLEAAVQATDAGLIDSACIDAPHQIWLDRNRMHLVLVNLLQNALDASAPAQRVEASLLRDGSELVYSIRDYGPGIPAADRARIFEPFFTTRFRGTGLGLAIVKRIVELHRGRIDVEDAPGGGARVSVRVPMGDPSTSPDVLART